MNRGVKKGTRMVYWSVLIGLRNLTWMDPAHLGHDNCKSKQELKKFLLDFKTSDWPQHDIISVKILRHKRIGTTTMWTTETMGYTDVTPQGTLYYIEL